MGTKKKNNYLVQGSILAAASILVRVIGLAYRIPMTNILGSEGNGIYSISFNIYNIVLILSSYSLPLAVSKMIAAKNVQKKYRESYRIFQHAFVFALLVGLVACLVLYFGADALAKLYRTPGVEKPLRILAPTVFVVALLGVFRGLFQGKQTMIPTALSQLIEQIVNAFVSVFAAYSFMKAHSASKDIAAYGAAGGTAGTLAGAVSALLFLVLIFAIYYPTLKRQLRRDKESGYESSWTIYQMLIATIFPVILSQTVYQLSGTLDDMMFKNVMAVKGMDDGLSADLIGVYGSQYRLLINVPVSISSAMASSLIPSIVSSVTENNMNRAREKVTSSVKFNMVIAIPAAVGLAVLAKPIMMLLFPSISNYWGLVASMMIYGSLAVVFYALSTITSAVLQGIDKMKLPVIHSLISLVIHIIFVLILLFFTNAGIYALIIGNVTFPLVVCILNALSVKKYMDYRQDVVKTFVVPAICSGIMGVFAFGTYFLVHLLCHQYVIALFAAIIIAVAVYLLLVLASRCFTQQELKELPFGRKILMIGRKLHFYEVEE